MNDNEALMILIPALRAGLVAVGVTGVLIKQSYQPEPTGAEIQPTLYLQKIQAPRYGFPGRKDVYNPRTNQFDHTESVWRAPTWQVDGLATQNPSNTSQLTASDIVEAAADALQQSVTRETLLAGGIGIERITNIREDYFLNDRERHQQRPSFDFTLTYRRVFSSTVPPVLSQVCNVRRV